MDITEKNIDYQQNLMYDDPEDTEIWGEEMKSREIIDAALKAVGMSQAAAATEMHWTPQQLNARLGRNSLRADEFLDMLDAIGIDVVFKVRTSGKDVKPHIAGAGRRVRAMVDKVIYDTANSDAMSNNFYADGVNEYTDGKAMELYIDKEGRYFFAEYSNWDGVKDRITPVSAKDAVMFIEKYGTEIHKQPKD